MGELCALPRYKGKLFPSVGDGGGNYKYKMLCALGFPFVRDTINIKLYCLSEIRFFFFGEG